MFNSSFTPLQEARLQYQPQLPSILKNLKDLKIELEKKVDVRGEESELLHNLFPNTWQNHMIRFKEEINHEAKKSLIVGVVLSGGQAAGGHNVIVGLFDALKTLNPSSVLLGFKDGPQGIISNDVINLTSELLASYRNMGGFDVIGSGRTKIETTEQFESAAKTIKSRKLDGLVIIGGDDSNTNAALLAEYFKEINLPCTVVGVPKTIDGDLKNNYIDISFGFDSACSTYSEIIGNIMRDALSAKKYYYFIKMMGRSASHIALECALKTHPNLTLIGEEIKENQLTLAQVTQQICDLICKRSEEGKNYGIILIPEGVIEFIPEFNQLIKDLNALRDQKTLFESFNQLQGSSEKLAFIQQNLPSGSKGCFQVLPDMIQTQLLLDRDPHGNVQVSKIEIERLFIALVETELDQRKKDGNYKGKFNAQPHFCGYEGRSCYPTNFDSQYCYTLGHVAALLVNAQATGYMACAQNLLAPVADWQIGGIPLTLMMGMEKRHGKLKPVITKALVDLSGGPFNHFVSQRDVWGIKDDYYCPGPIQFFGPIELTDQPPMTLTLEYNFLKAL